MLHDIITNLKYQYILNPYKFFIEAICSFIAISFCLYIIVSLIEYIISKNKKPIRHYFRITILRTETILLLAFCFMLPTFLNAYTFWYNVPEVAHFTSYMRLKTTRYALVQYGNGSVIGKNIKSNKKITWDDYSIVHSTHISKPYVSVTRNVNSHCWNKSHLFDGLITLLFSENMIQHRQRLLLIYHRTNTERRNHHGNSFI